MDSAIESKLQHAAAQLWAIASRCTLRVKPLISAKSDAELHKIEFFVFFNFVALLLVASRGLVPLVRYNKEGQIGFKRLNELELLVNSSFVDVALRNASSEARESFKPRLATIVRLHATSYAGLPWAGDEKCQTGVFSSMLSDIINRAEDNVAIISIEAALAGEFRNFLNCIAEYLND